MYDRQSPDPIQNAYGLMCGLLSSDPERLAFFKQELEKANLVINGAVNLEKKNKLAPILLGSLIAILRKIELEENVKLLSKQQELFKNFREAQQIEGTKEVKESGITLDEQIELRQQEIMAELRRLKEDGEKIKLDICRPIITAMAGLRNMMRDVSVVYDNSSALDALITYAMQDKVLSDDHYQTRLRHMGLLDPPRKYQLACALEGGLLISQQIPIKQDLIPQRSIFRRFLQWITNLINRVEQPAQQRRNIISAYGPATLMGMDSEEMKRGKDQKKNKSALPVAVVNDRSKSHPNSSPANTTTFPSRVKKI